jgi:hypothetical protein
MGSGRGDRTKAPFVWVSGLTEQAETQRHFANITKTPPFTLEVYLPWPGGATHERKNEPATFVKFESKEPCPCNGGEH